MMEDKTGDIQVAKPKRIEAPKEVEPVTFGESFGASQIAPKYADLLKILPDQQVALSFARIVITALNKDRKLQACTPESILTCVFDLAAINLQPNTPHQHAYLIPYKIDGEPTCTVQIGYKGFCELAYRSNEVKIVQADVVREGDEFKYLKGAGVKQFVSHIKDLGKGRAGREVIAAWASVELLNGGIAIETMESDELVRIKQIADRVKASPAWSAFPDEMRKKTVVKRLLKLLQIGNMETVVRAIEIDNRTSGLNLMPGFEAPRADHNILLKDGPMPEGSEPVGEPQPQDAAPESNGERWDPAKGEFVW